MKTNGDVDDRLEELYRIKSWETSKQTKRNRENSKRYILDFKGLNL
jgi:hypothetical protein